IIAIPLITTTRKIVNGKWLLGVARTGHTRPPNVEFFFFGVEEGEFLERVTEMRLVDSMCLVETERTEKEVWSWARKALRSDLEICFI
ncbi:6830_t:CDS:2, partial [Cetraspora pellucida]